MIRLLLNTVILGCLPVAALAGGTLEGRMASVSVLTYEDPAAPLLESHGRTVVVGPGVEFGMGPEGWTNGLDVVPVQVEIGPDSIEFSYGDEVTGNFWPARFNGYVLRFQAECALFTGARIDAARSTMAVTDADLRLEPRSLFINVAGRDYGPDQRLVIDLDVMDCPLS